MCGMHRWYARLWDYQALPSDVFLHSRLWHSVTVVAVVGVVQVIWIERISSVLLCKASNSKQRGQGRWCRSEKGCQGIGRKRTVLFGDTVDIFKLLWKCWNKSSIAQQPTYCWRRLCTHTQPIPYSIRLQCYFFDTLFVWDWVVSTQPFDTPAVPRWSGISSNNTVERQPLSTKPLESNLDWHWGEVYSWGLEAEERSERLLLTVTF